MQSQITLRIQQQAAATDQNYQRRPPTGEIIYQGTQARQKKKTSPDQRKLISRNSRVSCYWPFDPETTNCVSRTADTHLNLTSAQTSSHRHCINGEQQCHIHEVLIFLGRGRYFCVKKTTNRHLRKRKFSHSAFCG